MKSITRQKPLEEIEQQLDGLKRVYIIGLWHLRYHDQDRR